MRSVLRFSLVHTYRFVDYRGTETSTNMENRVSGTLHLHTFYNIIYTYHFLDVSNKLDSFYIFIIIKIYIIDHNSTKSRNTIYYKSHL